MPSVTFNPYGWIQNKEKVESFIARIDIALGKCEDSLISEELEKVKEEVLSGKMYNGKMEWLLTDIESRVDKEIDTFLTQFDN